MTVEEKLKMQLQGNHKQESLEGKKKDPKINT